MRLRLLAVAAVGLAAVLPISSMVTSCVPNTVNPYPPDAGTDAEGGSGGLGGDGGSGGTPTGDPTIGGPCDTDDDCDDGIACTLDACDLTIDKCRFTPDDSVCSNGKYCDGNERCDNKLGCTFGEPVGCDDVDSCTLDTCIEASQTCEHAPRDADLDGDPDKHCGGKDCDDTDALVSSLLPEVCGNAKDDNCNGTIDEATCSTPQNDVCLDALEVDAPGSYAMSTVAASYDYPSTCTAALVSPADAVAALVLPPGPPVDVELTVRTQYQDAAVTLAAVCGDPATEIACGTGFTPPPIVGGKLAKLRGRSLGDPSATTALPVYVTTAPAGALILDVAFFPPTTKPTNETCGTAEPAPFGVPFEVAIVDAATDLASGCAPATGELVYSFTLDQPQNVDIYATSTDGDGYPVLSLRNTDCALPEDEIACHYGQNAHLVAKSLPAGTYYLATAATSPTTMLVTIELSPPTDPPEDDLCEGAPALPLNKTIGVSLEDHQDNVQLGCVPGGVDAAYSLSLAEKSDVLLVQRTSLADTAGVALSKPACEEATDLLACGSGSPSPVRAAAHGVPAGDYRVVAESIQGSPVELTAFVRKAIPPTLVPFSDSCADVITIPETGGFFQGTTANALADFDAGCDQSGLPEYGAPEQLLKLVLSQTKRVVLDMMGSSYSTLLDVRKGPDCPGTEVPLACAAGYFPQRSFLDLKLNAGTYFIQIDGYAGQAGPWFLDVRVVDP
ncbi:MAG: MopE-related protein [Polyangiaceae bacterium]